jgi:hypothetical protein
MPDPGVHDADFGVHDADLGVHDAPIWAFTMLRFRCSRCADLGVHDAPISVFTMLRFPHRRCASSCATASATKRLRSFSRTIAQLLAVTLDLHGVGDLRARGRAVA